MPKCAFLSIANTEGWFIDDQLVHEPLQQLGWEVEDVPWDAEVDWNAYEVVVIRSPWDYQDHMDKFVSVLEEIEASEAILLNSLDLVKWNIDKNYLMDLQERGVELVPTVKCTGLTEEDIDGAFARFATEELIVKPMIGANADDTYRISNGDTGRYRELLPIFKGRECMLQPFMQAIVDEGEFSLMYFNGELSHSILKTVESGDYRVQEEHGGGVEPVAQPEEELLTTAEQIMSTLDETPFYARVDLVRTSDNGFALMELEMIEPCLYFRFDEASPMAFAKQIAAYWNTHKHSMA